MINLQVKTRGGIETSSQPGFLFETIKSYEIITAKGLVKASR
jgi:hypothetical protein